MVSTSPRPSVPPARIGTDGLIDDIKTARRGLLAMRHPVYHRILGALLDLVSGLGRDPAILSGFERAWRSRSFPTFYERPLLILAALRADALQEGTQHPLHAAIAAEVPCPSAVTTEAVAASLARGRLGVWSTMTTRRVQTNDTTRAVTWLWPASLAGCDAGRRRVALVDVGAAAGLNLIADRLPNVWTDASTGKEIPCATAPTTTARIGFDTRPLDAQSEDDVLWMRACIWPGDVERLARFDASVTAMRAAARRPSSPTVERLTASLVPARLEVLAGTLPRGALLLVYQTLVRGYLATTENESYERGMMQLLSSQPPGRVMWTELELDDERRRLPAALVAHVRGPKGVRSLRLGRSSQFPREIEVEASHVRELARYLSVD